jgi:hypothetical protein
MCAVVGENNIGRCMSDIREIISSSQDSTIDDKMANDPMQLSQAEQSHGCKMIREA